MAKAILVTGAAGFIAFHVIEALLRRGESVVGIDNFDPFYDPALKCQNIQELESLAQTLGTNFIFSSQDICELNQDVLKNYEFSLIIHLAAKAGVRPSLEDPEGYLRANVFGTLQVLEFARHRKIEKILFGSSSSVYGNDTPVPFREESTADRPISPYAASKRAGELYCYNYATLYGLTIAALRFFTVYGPKQRPDLAIRKFAQKISTGEVITLYGDGETERDYTYVTDIVTGVLGAADWVKLQKPGTYDVFNLGGSQTTSLKQLVALLEKNIKMQAKIRWAPMQPGDVMRTFADISKSKQAFGYAPAFPIEKGIARFAEWFLGQR
jgi:UDP-glucuronate 4-epimerase